jgi:transposase
MSNRRFEMFEYRQVIHRMKMGETDRAIARSKLMGRLKCAQVRCVAEQNGWLTEAILPDDQVLAEMFQKDIPNISHDSYCRPHEDQIEKWFDAGIQGTTIYRALVDQFGFSGSYSSVRRLLKKFQKQKPDVSCMLDFAPAEAAQVDFGKGPTIIDAFSGHEIKTWIFVMTLCFSRHMYAEIVTDQKVPTWLACHRRAFEFFNGIPHKLIIDNAKCAITRACFHDPEVQRSYGELAEGYGFLISPCPPREPKKKGRVESGVKYVKNSFVPLRQFRSLTDANEQLNQWLLKTAGNRIHGTTRQKPLTLFAETEKLMLKSLPDVCPQFAQWARVKLHGNCHVQFEKSYYSAPFTLARQVLWLKATDNTVKIYHDIKLVAVHPRLYKPGSKSTVNDHLPPEAAAFMMQDRQWCLNQAKEIGPYCRQFIHHLFNDRVLDNLRAAQGIIRLGKKYGSVRLEAACKRALFYGNPKYNAVKSILAQGLDQLALDNDNVLLSSTYTASARFMRTGAELAA